MLWNLKVYCRFQKESLIFPIPKTLQSSRTRPIINHCISLRFTVILESHLRSNFPSVPFLSDFHRKLLTHFLVSYACKIPPPPHIFLLDLFTFIMFGNSYKLCYEYLSHSVRFIACRNDMKLEKLNPMFLFTNITLISMYIFWSLPVLCRNWCG